MGDLEGPTGLGFPLPVTNCAAPLCWGRHGDCHQPSGVFRALERVRVGVITGVAADTAQALATAAFGIGSIETTDRDL